MYSASIPVEIRSAYHSDAGPVTRLVNRFSSDGTVLARTVDEVLEHIGNFVVAAREGRLVGCVALRAFPGDLEEIRSLAVSPDLHGQGVGTRLVEAAVDLARRRRTHRVFALTLRPHLFERLGFERVEHHEFPDKVWSDCRGCPKKDCCDEIALALYLQD